MSQSQQQPQHPQDVEATLGLEAAMATATIGSASSADDRPSQSGCRSNSVYTKGKDFKKSPDQASKSETRLHQTNSGGGGNANRMPASLPLSLQNQTQMPGLISPATSIGKPQQNFQGLDDDDNDLSFLELLGMQSTAEPRCQVPGSCAMVIVDVQPLPPPPMTLQFPQQPSPQTQQPIASPSSSKQGQGPVSADIRRRLIDKLKCGRRVFEPQAPILDENFNTQLHNAVQSLPAEQMDLMLSDLQKKKKLVPIINSLNCSGHTPLSLCLKLRRADLIPLLLRFDAAPTQLCGDATTRSNHFHYAMAKCLDTPQSLQMVCEFTSAICKHCHMDLSGLLAKNRHGKTAMDFLALRMFQVRSGQSDPASAEFLNMLQSLHNWLNSQLVAT